MTKEEAARKIKFAQDGYRKLLQENVDSGKFVGTGVAGTWKAGTPLNTVYRKMIEACGMAIAALEEPEPCEDTISRQAAIAALGKEPKVLTNSDGEISERIQWRNDVAAIRMVPPVRAVLDRKPGKWLPDNTNPYTVMFMCSECKQPQEVPTVMYKPVWEFCPLCGADLRERQE